MYSYSIYWFSDPSDNPDPSTQQVKHFTNYIDALLFYDGLTYPIQHKTFNIFESFTSKPKVEYCHGALYAIAYLACETNKLRY